MSLFLLQFIYKGCNFFLCRFSLGLAYTVHRSLRAISIKTNGYTVYTSFYWPSQLRVSNLHVQLLLCLRLLRFSQISIVFNCVQKRTTFFTVNFPFLWETSTKTAIRGSPECVMTMKWICKWKKCILFAIFSETEQFLKTNLLFNEVGRWRAIEVLRTRWSLLLPLRYFHNWKRCQINHVYTFYVYWKCQPIELSQLNGTEVHFDFFERNEMYLNSKVIYWRSSNLFINYDISLSSFYCEDNGDGEKMLRIYFLLLQNRHLRLEIFALFLLLSGIFLGDKHISQFFILNPFYSIISILLWPQ